MGFAADCGSCRSSAFRYALSSGSSRTSSAASAAAAAVCAQCALRSAADAFGPGCVAKACCSFCRLASLRLSTSVSVSMRDTRSPALAVRPFCSR